MPVEHHSHDSEGIQVDLHEFTHPFQLRVEDTLHGHRVSDTKLDQKVLKLPAQTVAPVPQPVPAKISMEKPAPKRRSLLAGAGWLMRRVVALLLVTVTIGWLVVPMVFPVTSHAVVNARVVQMRAPIDGTAEQLLANLGDHVTVDQPLVRLANTRLDTTHLAMLTTRRSELQARLKRLNSELGEMSQAEVLCHSSRDQYQKGRHELLESGLLESQASIAMARAQFESAKKQLQRLQNLSKRDAAAAADMEIALENESVARKRIEREEASLGKIRTELQALDRGLFLQTETPYFQQRSEELALKIPEVKANLRESSEMLAAVEREIAVEEGRIEKMSVTTADSPVSGVVWTRQSNAGQLVKQNEVMIEVADSSTIFIEAYVHQRHLSSVAIGGRATVLLTGGKCFEGRVKAIRTPGYADSQSSTALKLPNPDLKQVRVLIEFDAGEEGTALIGRHARVLLTDETPTRTQQALGWMFRLVGG